MDGLREKGKIASRGRPLLRFHGSRRAISTTVGCCLTYLLFLPVTLCGLDPNKHITQYMHTSWRTQDGSLPTGMHEIKQTSDGFLWFLSLPGDIYRFDGVRFVPWHLPGGIPFNSMRAMFLLTTRWALVMGTPSWFT